MRFLLLIVMCFSGWVSNAQDGRQISFSIRPQALNSFSIIKPQQNYTLIKNGLHLPETVSITYLSNSDGYFQRSWMIDENGAVVSTGFMPSAYFIPNRNRLVISGKNVEGRDSFNPYGADDVTTAIFFGAFNNFLSRFRWNKR